MKKSTICLFCAAVCAVVGLAGCFNVHIDLPELRTTAAAPTQDAGYAYDTTVPVQVPQTVLPTDAPATVAVPGTPVTEAPTAAVPATEAPKTPDAMTQAELLRFFNASLNRIKSENVGFTKSKLTSVLDLQLSNSAANAVVGLVKDSLLSETAEEKTVQKGSSGNDVFSPTGKSYISNLTPEDLTSITCTKNGDRYIIKLAVKGETNPAEGSIMSRGFDYITVDDVVNIYAPKVGATVARNDIQVVFSDCTATLTVDADGTVSAYETYVKGVMNMYNASIKKVITINTDVAVTLASTTKYTGFAY
ncbi:MAG: hypothetical protein IJT27_08775 [Clostridia bacterium]|nr:hypothetical protein [Clostridia bacterium]